jgi:hypothetical protein
MHGHAQREGAMPVRCLGGILLPVHQQSVPTRCQPPREADPCAGEALFCRARALRRLVRPGRHVFRAYWNPAWQSTCMHKRAHHGVGWSLVDVNVMQVYDSERGEHVWVPLYDHAPDMCITIGDFAKLASIAAAPEAIAADYVMLALVSGALPADWTLVFNDTAVMYKNKTTGQTQPDHPLTTLRSVSESLPSFLSPSNLPTSPMDMIQQLLLKLVNIFDF